SIIVPLPKIPTQIGTFEIAEEIVDLEGAEFGNLAGWKAVMVVNRVEERNSRGEKTIEDAPLGVVHSFHVRNPPVAVDLKTRNVAGDAANAFECLPAPPSGRSLLVESWLEVIQQVEFQVIDHRRGHLITRRLALGDLGRIRIGWRLEQVRASVQRHAGLSRDTDSLVRGSGEFRIPDLKSHLVVHCAGNELADRYRPSMGEKRPNAQVGIHSFNFRRVDRAIGIGLKDTELD